MKIGLVFVLIVLGVVLFLTLRSDPLKVELRHQSLLIYNKKCQIQIPVKVVEKKSDMVDMLQIQKILLESHGVRFFLEKDDLPAKYAFDKPYIDIVEKIFDRKFQEIFSGDGVIVYRGDFDVVLFYKTRHELVMLYPLNPQASEAIMACAKGEKREIKLRQMPLVESVWKPEFFILDGFINKDI
ncbi:MAG: hypothetical protein C6H99_00830 [Epsilonproteobacteria bacterium]|nr:hypothetical protein [Campylobacterota bacterium]NPA64162.1 hypothetical protein [Campylobacterota bacterium]